MRIQKIRVLLVGDTPNAVRKHGQCKQTVNNGVRSWWLTVPNDDTGWAVLQIAWQHVVTAPGDERRIVADAAIGCRVEDIPNVVVRPGVLGFEDAPNGDVLVGNLLTARSELDARANRVLCVDLSLFDIASLDDVQAALENATLAEDTADDRARAARAEGESWGAIRRQLAERLRDLERQPVLPLATAPATAPASDPPADTAGETGDAQG